MSEVRGSGREWQAAMAQERLRGATLCPRSGGAAERSYPASEVRGSDERSYSSPPRPRPGLAARRTNPTPESRGSGQENQPHIRGQGPRPGGPNPRPRSCGCTGVGGPGGATPR